MKNRLPDLAVELTPELEDRILELHKEASALHLGVLPVLYIETKITNLNGTIVEENKYKANSFNRNFYNFIAGVLTSSTFPDAVTFGAGKMNYKDITGTVRTSTSLQLIQSWGVASGSNVFVCGAAVGNHDFGIMVGSGNSAESFEGYDIQTKITHGVGAGNLQYGATTSPSAVATYNAPTKTWTQQLIRTFTNSSGGDVVVNETCLITNGSLGGAIKTMVERTVFPSTKTVGNGQVLTVTYAFALTFPE